MKELKKLGIILLATALLTGCAQTTVTQETATQETASSTAIAISSQVEMTTTKVETLEGIWKPFKVKVSGKEASMEDLKKVLSEEDYKQLLVEFTFSKEDVEIKVNGENKGKTGITQLEDLKWEDQTKRFTFVIIGDTLEATSEGTTLVLKKGE